MPLLCYDRSGIYRGLNMKIRVHELVKINNGRADIEKKGELVFQTDVEDNKEEIRKEMNRWVPDKKKKYILVIEKSVTANQLLKKLGVK